MADPKTILQLTERSGALAATDEIEVQVSGETTTKRKALSAVKTLVLGTAVIGGNAAGDIITTNGTQTQTNKTMTSPRINTPTLNNTTAITVTGDNVNSLTNMTANVKDAIDALVADVADKADLVEPEFDGLTCNGFAALPATTNIGDVTPAQLACLDGVTSAIQTQLNAKANLASPTFTGTVSGITKAMVGLTSVNDTSDADKPVSTAQQAALNLKANLASPTFTGSSESPVVLPTHTNIGNVGFAEIARLDGASENIQAAITAIRAALPTVYSYTKTVSYQATVGAGATSLAINQAAILSILGLATTDYVVDHTSIVPAIYEVNGTYYMEAITRTGGVTVSFTVQTINSQVQLDTLTFGGLSEGKVYQIAFTCKVIIKATP